MSVPVSQAWTVTSYILKQKLRRRKRFPLVLMLEPLYRCNLSCAGCGKIQYPANILKHQLSVEECLRVADECGAPVVSLPGGEPLLHPQIDEIVQGLIRQGRFIHLCTNGLLLEEKLDLFEPSDQLSFTVHMDGLEDEHDFSVCREGVYEKAHRAIRKAVARGFRVTTNTTLFEGADPDRAAAFFDEMMRIGVDGMMVSPGYSYEKAPDQQHFLARDRTRELFRKIFSRGIQRWTFNQSPLFIEFLAGARHYDCTPWAMPTYSVFGWQKPCYLLQEGYAKSYDELLATTQWEGYGHASGNPACENCMVHSGFEGSAVMDAFSSWKGFVAMARAFLFGPDVERDAGPDPHPIRARASAAQEALPTRGWAADASPDAFRAAFAYRGDVTLTLRDGSTAEGYVSNLDARDLELWRKGSDETRRISRAEVQHLALTGRDTASGRSYETWLRTWQEKHRASA